MIYAPSGKPIKYIKGVPTEHGFEEVPDEEIVKGYEHAKGQRGLLLTILRYGNEGRAAEPCFESITASLNFGDPILVRTRQV
jgi:non-homologous end joining protein Ku